MSASHTESRVRFPDISAESFVSAMDRTALQNLQRLPLLPVLVRKFNEFAVDRVYYVQNSAESVRCGPRQFSTAHELMREACSILDVAEPELYVRYSSVYNAYTAGVNRTFVVLESSLVDALTDTELLFVIGHELGHVKCGHVLYQMLGRLLIPMLEAVGQFTLGLGQLAGMGLVSGFFEWMRQAEFSCDRAGLLVCQDPRAAFSATMKLGCGSTRFDGEMDVDEFLKQARNHSAMAGMEGLTKALLFVFYNWQLTHPQVVFRAKELDEWLHGGAYARILSGDYLREAPGVEQEGPHIRCPACSMTVSTLVRHCPRCGKDLTTVAPAAPTACTECASPIPPGGKFCPECGAPVRPAAEEPI
ncbi:MAG TPA: M48 family metallopeptidase [Armatimonadota bacterium]|nr:M48 family metallopeptidase [Armatimonadota bacterium]